VESMGFESTSDMETKEFCGAARPSKELKRKERNSYCPLKAHALQPEQLPHSRNPSRIDAKRGDHSVQAELPGTNPANFHEPRLLASEGHLIMQYGSYN
jgi:hypothetical protein